MSLLQLVLVAPSWGQSAACVGIDVGLPGAPLVQPGVSPEVTYCLGNLGNVSYPLGPVSFADRVDTYLQGPDTNVQNPAFALGPTVFPYDSVSLGDDNVTGGSIIVEFVDNRLVDQSGYAQALQTLNDGTPTGVTLNPDFDLYIVEGGSFTEGFEVSISTDGNTWIALGPVVGWPTGIDIGPFVLPTDQFRFVRLDEIVDGSTHDGMGYSGADIVSIGAIGSVAVDPECDLDPSATAECDLGPSGNTLGTWTTHVTLTNTTGGHVSSVSIPDVNVSPNIVSVNANPGDVFTFDVTVDLLDDSAQQYCFDVVISDDEGEECCSERVCVELPACSCASPDLELVCNADGTMGGSLTLTNQTTVNLEHLFVQPVTPGVVINPSYVDIATLAPQQSVVVPGFDVGGAVPGTSVCVEVEVHDAELEECCIEIVCDDAPFCDGGVDPGKGRRAVAPSCAVVPAASLGWFGAAGAVAALLRRRRR